MSDLCFPFLSSSPRREEETGGEYEQEQNWERLLLSGKPHVHHRITEICSTAPSEQHFGASKLPWSEGQLEPSPPQGRT